jgi:hypothetical protein
LQNKPEQVRAARKRLLNFWISELIIKMPCLSIGQPFLNLSTTAVIYSGWIKYREGTNLFWSSMLTPVLRLGLLIMKGLRTLVQLQYNQSIHQ